jgi:hypothetical protein
MMLKDVWFWIALASYIGGGINLVIWITDNGSVHANVPRVRVFAVAVFWPLCTAFGLAQAFFDWFFKPPALAEED